MNKQEILGVEFDSCSVSEAVECAMRLMKNKDGAYAVTPNSEIVLEARKNKRLRQAIKSAQLVLPDGVGVVYASRILGSPLEQKVCGVDFAAALLARMSESGMSVFLLGAKPGIAEQAAEAIKERYPGIKIAGTNDGYFVDDSPVIHKINSVSPDFLMVCLGAPKQEIWMSKNHELLKVGLMTGLGGVLDVYAGVVELAPQKWRDSGFEWLYRLIKEPWRIKRMIKLPLIIFAALWKRIKG